MQWSSRPVILVGHGCRMAGVDMKKLTDLCVPLLFSWQAMDLLDSDHQLNFGRPGLYGQRLANKILYNADMVLAIGCRMSIWQCGYDLGQCAPNAKFIMVDIDQTELDANPHAEHIKQDAKEFTDSLDGFAKCADWLLQCNKWKKELPWVESPTHDDGNYIHSHRFMERLQSYLKPDQIIVTDMGTAMIAAHQVLRLKPPQRIMTSGGLGEMGCALPAAIGASFATGKGEVLCLHCDGGFMMNAQELATIRHHDLPIKIVLFENDGYGMIRVTQDNAGYARVATDQATGVSFPDFNRLANAFYINTYETIEDLMCCQGPGMLVVKIDPEQPMLPKMNPIRLPDGRLGSPRFDQLSPIL